MLDGYFGGSLKVIVCQWWESSRESELWRYIANRTDSRMRVRHRHGITSYFYSTLPLTKLNAAALFSFWGRGGAGQIYDAFLPYARLYLSLAWLKLS
jgi:hypothetical protein